MKNKGIKIAVGILLIALQLFAAVPCFAAEQTDKETAESIVRGIVAQKQTLSAAENVQQWIDGALTENAGVTSEWYAVALSQFGDYRFDVYENALCTYLAGKKVNSASSRLKYAFTLLAIGSDAPYIVATAQEAVGQQGIMSWIYGLHLLRNGVSGAYTETEMICQILQKQLADGGWAISGENGDVDVTAMAIQALAPSYQTDSTVTESIDRALKRLEEQQLADGDFASYGVSNPESTIQVLLALACLGIDGQQDVRFIKNGHTLLDGVLKYRLQDGLFSHQLGGTANENATQQVLYGAVAYLRFHNKQPSLFYLDAANTSEEETSASSIHTQQSSSAPVVSENRPPQTDEHASGGYVIGVKEWLCLALLASGALIALFIGMKKKNRRNALVVALLFAAAAIVVWTLDLQTPEDYYADANSSKKDPIGTVMISIQCDKIKDQTASNIPEDGIILEMDTVQIESGDTVYDVLREVTAKHQLHMETNGAGDGIYVEGLQYIYEFAYGDLSGWVYRVNGVRPSIGCSAYVLADGDRVEWIYSLALGDDLT